MQHVSSCLECLFMGVSGLSTDWLKVSVVHMRPNATLKRGIELVDSDWRMLIHSY